MQEEILPSNICLCEHENQVEELNVKRGKTGESSPRITQNEAQISSYGVKLGTYKA